MVRCTHATVATLLLVHLGAAFGDVPLRTDDQPIRQLLVKGHPVPIGEPTPLGYGLHPLDEGTPVEIAAASPVDVSNGVRWCCVGWTGTGSVPASGTGTSVVFTIVEDSTLTWEWRQEFFLGTAANGAGSVNPRAQWIHEGTNVTLTARAAPYHHFSHWSGDVDGGEISGRVITVPMDRPRALVAGFDVNRLTYTIDSAYGGTAPPTGVYTQDAAAVVACSVTNAVVCDTWWTSTCYVCTGWVGRGSAPPAGSTTNTGGFALTSSSFVTWQWATNNWLNLEAGNGGSIDLTSGWYTAGAVMTIHPRAEPERFFVGWTGDVAWDQQHDNPLVLTNEWIQYVTADFARRTMYVDAAASASGDGSSWAEAATNLAEVLWQAVAGQQIWVAEGTYRPGSSRGDAFMIPEGVSLYGGFTNGAAVLADRDPRVHPTVLSGEIGVAGDISDNVRHVVVFSGSGLLDGFTIRDGYADGTGDDACGGGASARARFAEIEVVLRDCEFTDNAAVEAGGALYAEAVTAGSRCALDIEDCAFADNSATGEGGALSLVSAGTACFVEPRLSGCRFTGNVAGTGGAVAYRNAETPFGFTLTDSSFGANAATNGCGGALYVAGGAAYGIEGVISNCCFAANAAADDGGAVFARCYARSLGQCDFSGNTAGGRGGGLLLADHGVGTVVRCRFAGNAATDGAGLAVCRESPTVRHCVFAGNTASGEGAVYLYRDGDAECTPRLVSCTFGGNRGTTAGGLYLAGGPQPSFPQVVNSVLWGDAAAELYEEGLSVAAVRNSCVEGGAVGAGTIDADPEFAVGTAGRWTAAPQFAPWAGQSVLTDATAAWTPNALAGTYVAADTNMPRQWLVASNGVDTLVVWGDLSGNAGSNTPYRVFDYRLGTTNSPCRDTGVNVGYAYLGSAPDMGAYEWGTMARVRVYLEGCYATNLHAMHPGPPVPAVSPYADDTREAGDIPVGAVDWVLLQWCATNGELLASQSAFVLANGRLTDGQTEDALMLEHQLEYPAYLVVKHRNHLAVMSSTPLDTTSQQVDFDFTEDSASCRGGAAGVVELEPGVWGMVAGDADGDGIVGDADAAIAADQAGTVGTVRGDFTLDGRVSEDDAALHAANRGRRSAAFEAGTELTPRLELDPAGVLLAAGAAIPIAAADGNPPLAWVFVTNGSGGSFEMTGATSILYRAGVVTGVTDVVEAWDRDGRLGRASVCVVAPEHSTSADRAIVVAGTRGASDAAWPDTAYMADMAYLTLRCRGYERDHVIYLSQHMCDDVDGNGADDDDIDGLASTAALAAAITNGVGPGEDLFLYLADHGEEVGGVGCFQLNGDQIVTGPELSAWLDTMQQRLSNNVVVVIECCHAGAFLDDLAYAGPGTRTLIASCTDGELAYFLAGGLVSFSEAFFGALLVGQSVGDGFELARRAMSTFQHAWLDDTGDGIYSPNGPDGDGANAAALRIGATSAEGLARPVIGAVCGAQTLQNTTAAVLWADDVRGDARIVRVWCVVIPPEHTPRPDRPVCDVPELELSYNRRTGRYEATYSGFAEDGLYTVVFYAMDRTGSLSLPVRSYVMQDRFDERAIVVVGAVRSEQTSIVNNIGAYAYRVMRSRRLSDDAIQYLAGSGGTEVDGPATEEALSQAIGAWAASADKLTVYLIGDGQGGAFVLAPGATVTPVELDGWLDAYQRGGAGRDAIVVLEYADSGGATRYLAAPYGSQRLVVTATQRGGQTLRAANGVMSFSQFFLSGLFAGYSVGDAFERTAEGRGGSASRAHGAYWATRFASFDRQIPLLDMDANGSTSTAEKEVARDWYIGSAFHTGADAPVIDAVNEDAVLASPRTVTLWAAGVADLDGISNVWVAITPPGYDGTGAVEQVTLAPTGEWGAYTGEYAFATGGTYTCTFFAIDGQGELSQPKHCRMLVPDPYEPDDAPERATPTELNRAQLHNLHTASDEDWVAIYALDGYFYTVEAMQFGTNIDLAIDIYRETAGGVLELVTSVNGASRGMFESEGYILFGCKGRYLFRLRSVDGSWGIGSDYQFGVWLDTGGMIVSAVAIDRLTEAAVRGAVASVDGVPFADFHGMMDVDLSPVCQEGVYTVGVTAPGYEPYADPNDPHGVDDPDNPGYGNPRRLTVTRNGVMIVPFLMVPVVRASGELRDAWTGAPVSNAVIRFRDVTGVLDYRVCDRHPAAVPYASPWLSLADGRFPTNVWLPTVSWDLEIECPGYMPLRYGGAIWNPACDSTEELGRFLLTPADDDGDGLPTEFEQRYGGGKNLEPWDDEDDDGRSNWQEYMLGTDPTNAMSVLALDPIAWGAGSPTLRWGVVAGRSYRLRSGVTLGGGLPRVRFGPREAASGETRMEWSEPEGDAPCFYQLDVLLPERGE